MALVVKKLQFQEVNATTRVVLDLTAPPKDMVIEDNPGKPMTIRFAGNSPSLVKPLNRNFSWPNLSGVYIDPRNGKIQLFIKRNTVGTVTVNTEANKLVITVPHYGYKMSGNSEISPGVRYLRFNQSGKYGTVQVNVLEIDPKNPAVEISPALAANRMGAKANVARIVANNQAVAGVNGSFFKPDVGIPLGILIINQELISGPIFDRVALGITPTNDLVMARIRLAGEVVLPDGRRVPVHNINQPRVLADQTVVYSSRWGATAPKVPQGGYQVQIRNNRIAAVSHSEPLAIPRDGVVISGPGSPEMTSLAALSLGRPVQLNVYTLPDWSGMKHAIGGGPWLVREGRPYIDSQAQHFGKNSLGNREPRTAVGVTANGNMLLVTVDGRQGGTSVGMTLPELSQLMQKLGAVHAMNLDGGSSTQMAIYGKLVNSPSSGGVGVSNSLIIRKSNGDDMAWRQE